MAELTTTGTNPTEPAAEEGRPTSDRLLLILAVDHRNSLERDLYGLAGTIGPAEAARISADKLLVYQALLDALPRLPAEVQPGILIDEQYGASVAELAGRSQGVVSLAMPIEASGEEWFEFAYGDDWTGHAEFFATDFAKVLMRDNPGFDAGRRAKQADRLSQVSRWAEASGRAFIIELLVPATDTDLAAVDGDRDRYDDEVRPRHTLAVMEHLQDHGVDRPSGRSRASTATMTPCRSPGRPRGTGGPLIASCSGATPPTTSWTTGFGWPHRSPGGPASPSAAASGGTPSTRACTITARPARPVIASARPMSILPATTSTPGPATYPTLSTLSTGERRSHRHPVHTYRESSLLWLFLPPSAVAGRWPPCSG